MSKPSSPTVRLSAREELNNLIEFRQVGFFPGGRLPDDDEESNGALSPAAQNAVIGGAATGGALYVRGRMTPGPTRPGARGVLDTLGKGAAGFRSDVAALPGAMRGARTWAAGQYGKGNTAAAKIGSRVGALSTAVAERTRGNFGKAKANAAAATNTITDRLADARTTAVNVAERTKAYGTGIAADVAAAPGKYGSLRAGAAQGLGLGKMAASKEAIMGTIKKIATRRFSATGSRKLIELSVKVRGAIQLSE